MFWSGKWKCEVVTTLLTLNTTEAQHSQTSSSTRQVLLYFCTLLIQDAFAFLFNLSASIWEAFFHKYQQRQTGSFRQLLTIVSQGREYILGKKLTHICVRTNLRTLPHSPSSLCSSEALHPQGHTWTQSMCSARMSLKLKFNFLI